MARKTNFVVNGKEYYKVSRTVGKKADGTPIRKVFYGAGINEANEKADQYMNDIKNGLLANHESITINKLMHTWLFDFLHNSIKIKPSTFQRYEGIYRNYIKDSTIAGVPPKDLTTLQLQNFYNKLSETHSYSQLNTLNSVFKVFYNWCIDNGYSIKNPCSKVILKGNKSQIAADKHKEVEILTENEIKIIKDYIKGSSFELIFLLDLTTGLRIGELLALDWGHIDLKKKELSIEKSVKEVYVYDSDTQKHIESIFQTPKTNNSYRKVPIPDALIPLLKKEKQQQKSLLFCNENNEPLKAKNVANEWRKILIKCKIPHKKFHAIRHTYGSMLLKNGVDIKTLADLMGHTTISITQIYLHSSCDQKHNAVNKINYLI